MFEIILELLVVIIIIGVIINKNYSNIYRNWKKRNQNNISNRNINWKYFNNSGYNCNNNSS